MVQRAQRGDVDAFEGLISKHLPQIRRFARAFAKSEADADDLAQEAVIKVFRALGGFRFSSLPSQRGCSRWSETPFGPSQKSRQGRQQASESPLDGAEEPAEAWAPHGGEAAVLSEERRAILWQAIRQLPPEFRTTLVLCDIEGHPYEDVAQMEDVALGTVKSRLSRARQHLRVLLDPEKNAHHKE